MSTMLVRVTLPSRQLGSYAATKLVARGASGSFCILPRHVDWLAILQPGIIAIQLENGTQTFVATDSGVLVKRAGIVDISVRRAMEGRDLAEIRDRVEDLFRERDEQDLEARSAATKLEVGFVRRFLELQEGDHV